MGKSTISMAIFHCYVSSPEGIQKWEEEPKAIVIVHSHSLLNGSSASNRKEKQFLGLPLVLQFCSLTA